MALIWKWGNESIDGYDGSLFPRSLLRASQIALKYKQVGPHL